MFDNNNEYKLCPESFRFNCASFETLCHQCGACDADLTKPLEYIPIQKGTDLGKTKHPFLASKKQSKKAEVRQEKLAKKKDSVFQAKSKQVKSALKSEKTSLKSIGAKSTIASGRFDGSGDGFISINNIKYYIEVKTRYSEKASMFPTSAEWNKAVGEQGCSLFMVESAKGNTVTMSKSTFMEIIGC